MVKNTEYEELRLFANLPIYVDNIPIYSPILKDIAAIGMEQYQILLTHCTITKDKIKDCVETEVLSNFDALIYFINTYPQILETILISFYFFTKIDFQLSMQDGDFIFLKEINNGDIRERIVLSKANYDSFIDYVNLANNSKEECLEDLDEFDRQVLEMEKKIAQAQNRDVEQPAFKDLVSWVANVEGNNLNIINIWDINIYQFSEQLHRGMLIDNRNIGIQQILAGADPDNIQIESYLKKL